MTKREVKRIIKDAICSGRRTLLEPEAKALVSAWGIPVPNCREVLQGEAVGFSSSAVKGLAPPFVLKVVSPDILHKSEVGGVVTGIKDGEAVDKALKEMVKGLKEKAPNARIEGFLLEEMAPKGVEVIIGVLRDPQFGPVVMSGIGGVMVELMKDVSFRLPPVGKREALDMVRELKGYPLLTGFRGSRPVDMEALTLAIIKVSEILPELEDIKELEINPLMAYEGGVMAVDVRVVICPQEDTRRS